MAEVVDVDVVADYSNFSVLMNHDVKPGATFDDADIKFFKSENGVKRTSDQLSKLRKVSIKAVAVVHDSFSMVGSVHNCPSIKETADNLLGTSNADLKIVLSTNASGNRMVFTPWIVMHRAVHAVMFTALRDRSEECYDAQLWESVNSAILAFCVKHELHDLRIHLHRPTKNGNVTCALGSGPHHSLMGLFMLLATMRSARTAQLYNTADVTAELFAQHHFSDVTFTTPDQWQERVDFITTRFSSSPLDHTYGIKKVMDMLMASREEVEAELLPELKNIIIGFMDQFTEAMKGKVFYL